MNIPSFLTSESVIGGVIGALVGSASAWALQAFFESRRRCREERRTLVIEATTLVYDFIAQLEELGEANDLNARKSQGALLAQLTRLSGAFVAIQTRFWVSFSQFRVKAAITRLSSRAAVIRERVTKEPLSTNEIAFMIGWFQLGQLELRDAVEKAAKMPSRSSRWLPVFVGFRKVTYEDIRLLKAKDEPPPWEFSVQLNLRKQPDPAAMESLMSSAVMKRCASLYCKEHCHRVRILLEGEELVGAKMRYILCCKKLEAQLDEVINEESLPKLAKTGNVTMICTD